MRGRSVAPLLTVVMVIGSCGGDAAAPEPEPSPQAPSPTIGATSPPPDELEPTPDPVGPSAECLDLMHEAESAPVIADQEVQALVDSLTACETAEQWLAAVLQVPGAMGLTERAEIGDLDLQIVCYRHDDTPVCRDAAAAGRI